MSMFCKSLHLWTKDGGVLDLDVDAHLVFVSFVLVASYEIIVQVHVPSPEDD
jgi:hypothetical protein